MKILLVSQYYYPERNSVHEIAEELVRLGNQVSVLTAKPNYGFDGILEGYENKDYEEINGVNVHRVNIVPRRNSRKSLIKNYLSFHKNAKRFVRHFKEEFDIVLSVSLSPVISIAPAVLYARKHKVSHVLLCEDLWPESPVSTGFVKRNSPVYRILYKWSKKLYKKCDEIIVTSASFKEYFNDVLKITDKKFPYINQPILNGSNQIKDAVEYENKTTLVYAGNFGKLQMVDRLVEAIKPLIDEDIKLHLFGNGAEKDNVLKIIKDNNLENKVEYHGALPLEEVERYYANASALIVPLKNEGYVGKTIPNKAIQYLKYGRPIIGIISNDAKALLEEAGGAIFANDDIDSITESYRQIIDMKDKDLFGLKNKYFFEKNLSVETIVCKIERVLKDNTK